MPRNKRIRFTFKKHQRTSRHRCRTLSQALALLATKLPQDNMLEAEHKACQTDFTEPNECNNEEEKIKDLTTSDPLHHWSDIYVKEEPDFDEVPSSTTAFDTKCNSLIYIKIRRGCKKRKATQTNEQDVTQKDEVVRIKTDEHAMTCNTRTIESGKRIPKPSFKLLMGSWESLKKKSRSLKKPKVKQTERQKLKQERLKQIMIESKTPSETTTQKRYGCGLCDGCSFTTLMDSDVNRQLELRKFIKSAPPQQVVAETNAPISNEQVPETNVSANNEQVAEINTGVNSGQQSVVTNTHSTVLEVVSADLVNALIEANLHEKSGETNENKQLATETNAPINNEQVLETNVLANNEQVPETNASVNSEQSVVTDAHLTVAEMITTDLDNTEVIEANLHEKCGQKIIETNESGMEIETIAENEQLLVTQMLINGFNI